MAHYPALFISGSIIVGLDTLALLVWLFSTIFVGIHDVHEPSEPFALEHILVAFHFNVTVALYLALQALDGLKRGHRTHLGYELAWAVAFVVAIGTDALSTMMLFMHPKPDVPIWVLEAVLAIWGCVITASSIFWSIGFVVTVTTFESAERRTKRI